MNLAFVIEYEHDAFTSLGSTPSLSISLALRRGPHGRLHSADVIFSLGGTLAVGIRPFRIGWNRRWIYARTEPTPAPPIPTEGSVNP
jgi:hypothetical protein